MSQASKYQFRLEDVVRRIMWSRKVREQDCSHLDQIQDVSPSVQGCEGCLRIGDTWVHLRMCLICGHVGCCDNSKNKHATAHFNETGHPLIMSLEPGEDWMWCYLDKTLMSTR